MDLQDRYRRLGLARNPFVAEPRPGVAREVYVDRGVPPAPSPAAKRFVQVVGERGAGKTTLLLKWREERFGPYRHVPPSLARVVPPPVAPLCFWDEADRLPRALLLASLWRAARLGATVVVGTHVDLGALAARLGLTVETHTFGPLSADDVLRWAELHIGRQALGQTSLTLPRELAAHIAATSGGSWRIAGDRLHVWCAELAASTNHNQSSLLHATPGNLVSGTSCNPLMGVPAPGGDTHQGVTRSA